MWKFALVVMLCMSALASSTNAQESSRPNSMEQKASNGTPGKTAYRIGPLDALEISVFQAPDLSVTVEVAEDGTIDLPLLGTTPAAGKTAYELQRELSSKLGAKYLQNPQVTVSVKEFNSSRVTLSGAVKNPGVFRPRARPFYSMSLRREV